MRKGFDENLIILCFSRWSIDNSVKMNWKINTNTVNSNFDKLSGSDII